MPAQATDKAHLRRIALILREVRQEKGMTQERFMDETGIHIARIERAGVSVGAVTMKRICDELGISVSDFYKRVEAI